jgi:thiol:disulfide interchange protein DsbD
MKHLLAFIILIATALGVHAQSDSVAHWQYTAEKKGAQEYVLHFTGTIEKGWKLFSTTMPDDQPNTRVALDSGVTISGITEEGGLKQAKEPLLDNYEIKYFEDKVILNVAVHLGGDVKSLAGAVNYMALKGEEILGPEEFKFKFKADASGNLVDVAAGLQEATADAANSLKRNNIKLSAPVITTGEQVHEQKSLMGIFLLGLIGGFIALVTPCVFPLIPLTVSFFTKKSQDRRKGVINAITYGFFIFLIYVLLSTPFYFLSSIAPEIFNNISTNVWLNLVFFVIFIVFAVSFFGVFEITIPSSVASKVDSKSGVGGLVGIFFMALTLALVSFSCTGPILGSLLAGALTADGGAVQLTAGMAGFGFALALPFALFALFPNLLSALPKSGGWLSSVKVVLGFIEIGMAIKFLSNADLVAHWGIVKREIFFAVWIICGILIVLYLLGKIRFPHDSPVKKFSITRIIFIIVFAGLTLYMLPGLTNTKYANRKLISGFPPPLSYSLYNERVKGVEANVVNDYEKALELAKKEHKPILIDFTGWACVNCRKMEENVWTTREVKELIENDYILVSLYVDDRKVLPEDQQFLYTTTNGQKKEIKTIGDKYATMQTENFINNSQPFYVLISPDEQLLTTPVGYTPNVDEYAKWLKTGLEAYKKVK